MYHVRFLKDLVGKLVLVLALCAVGLSVPGSMGIQVAQGAPVAPVDIGPLYTACSGERIDAVQYIDTDTTWSVANSPLHIGKHVEVMPGATLTIEPGMEVWIGYKLYIHICSGASVVAKGTPDQHIVFTRYTPDEGPRWNKIWFHGDSTSYFRYTDFSYGGAAASDDDTILHYDGTGTHVLNNCVLEASKQQGIVATGDGLNLTIAGTTFQKNGRRSLMIDDGANVNITGCTFDDTDDTAIYLRNRPTPPIVTVRDSNLDTFGQAAIYSEEYEDVCVDAQENWWGSANGPTDGSSSSDACGLGNHYGGGSSVSNGVDYRNWLTAESPGLGITTSPVATFTVSPDPTMIHPPGTTYTFDASGTTDEEDYASSLEVCWDWDDSGECDTAWTTDKTEMHSFSGGAAVQTVRLFVRDTDDLVSEATQELVLNSPPVADLTVDPDPGVARLEGTEYEFDASGSSDEEDSTAELEVCWDWDNSGECDDWTTDKTETHSFTYDDGAEQIVRLVVRDTAESTDDITETIHVLENLPPAATFTISQTVWNRVDFDASATTDDYDDSDDLQLAWDYEGDGEHTSYVDFTGAVTEVYTYPHQGRYWPALYAKDTGDKVGVARQTLDILPPAKSITLTGGGGTLTSVDGMVEVALYTDTVASEVISGGLVFTHTPWLNLPHIGLDGFFAYQGFNLSACPISATQEVSVTHVLTLPSPLESISGTYTITLSYDYDYFADVLRLPFEDQLELYHWSEGDGLWETVAFTLDKGNDQLEVSTGMLGDFALVIEATRIYLPVISRE